MLSINKMLLLLLLFVMSVVLGIWLPTIIFTENIGVMQILVSILLLCPFAYLIFRMASLVYTLQEQLKRGNSARQSTLNLCSDLIDHSFSYETYELILKEVINLLQADRGCIATINKHKDIEYKTWIGYGEEEKTNIKFPVISGDIESTNTDTRLYAPLYLEGGVIGYLYVERLNGKGFDKEDHRIIHYFGELSSRVINIYELVEGISHLARYDDLTNTFNRRHFIELFTNTCLETYRTEQAFSLVYFDIDNLKITNDQFGHHYGDQVIKTFSKVIQDNIRDSDLFSRFGGDEFIAVLFQVDKERIRKRIQNIEKQLMENPIITKQGKIHVKFSYGIANYPEDAKELNQLIQVADNRMYTYKEHLKNGA